MDRDTVIGVHYAATERIEEIRYGACDAAEGGATVDHWPGRPATGEPAKRQKICIACNACAVPGPVHASRQFLSARPAGGAAGRCHAMHVPGSTVPDAPWD